MNIFQKTKNLQIKNYFTSSNLFVKFKNVHLLKNALCIFIEVVEIKAVYLLNYAALTHQLYMLTLEKRRIDHFALF